MKIKRILIGLCGTAVAAALGSYFVLMNNRAVYGPPEPIRVDISQEELELYNKRFEQYVGTNKRYSEVVNLLKQIEAHNANTQEIIKYGTIEVAGFISYDDMKINAKFTVEITAYNSNGFVSEVMITEQQLD